LSPSIFTNTPLNKEEEESKAGGDEGCATQRKRNRAG